MGRLLFFLLVIFFLSGTACNKHKQNQKQGTRTTLIQTQENLIESSKNYLKVWSNNDTLMLRNITIHNIVRNVNGEITSSDQKGLAVSMNLWHTALPDFKVVEKEIIVKGNRTYVNWTGTGTNTGMYGNITPTGKKSETEGFSILTFDNSGRLIHENVFFDMLMVMKDWGYTLLPPHTE